MKRLFLILFSIALFIPVHAFAIPLLSLNSSSMDVIAEAGVTELSHFQVTNLGDTPLYNLTIEPVPEFSFPMIPKIDPNETKLINFTAISTNLFDKTITMRLKFTYLQGSPPSSRTFIVNSTNNSFQPSITYIKPNDIIRWNNIGNSTHNVQSNNSLFDSDITSGSFYQFQFSSIGETSYINKYASHGGIIVVQNITVLETIYDPNLDKTLSIHYVNQLPQGNLTLTLSDNNFSIKYNLSTESALTLRNSGSNLIKNIRLSSSPNWIIFNENNFDISAGSSNALTYTIDPTIIATDETNRTYNLTISVIADNMASFSQNMKVFIPYENLVIPTTSNASIEELRKLLAEQIAIYIGLLDSFNNTATQTNPNFTFADFNITTNMTYGQLQKLFLDVSEVNEKIERYQNVANGKIDNTQTEVNNLTVMTNELRELAKLNSKYLASIKTQKVLTFLFVVLAGFTGTVIFIMRKIRRERDLNTMIQF